MREIRWGRVLRLGVTALLGVALFGNVFLAWGYVSALIRPACHPPRVNPDLPTPQTYTLTTKDGISVEAWYYPSHNGAVIIALGGQQGALGVSLPSVEVLVENGYGVLQIGSRVCATPPSPVTLGAKETLDAAAGLEFLLTRPEVDVDKIGVFGFSMGGVTAIRTAAQNERVAAVLAEGGFFNLGADIVETGTKKPFPQAVFLYTIAGLYWLRTGINPWKLSPIDDLPSISPREVFLVYGENEIDSGRGWEQYEVTGEPKGLWVVPQGDHGQNHTASPEEYDRQVLSFFDRVLMFSGE